MYFEKGKLLEMTTEEMGTPVYHMEIDEKDDQQILYSTDKKFGHFAIENTQERVNTDNILISFASDPRSKGFVQLNLNTTVITQAMLHCVTTFDRNLMQTVVLAGPCEWDNHGYIDGVSSDVRFHHPVGIVEDKRDSSYVIVADYANKCLRYVNIHTGTTSTFITLLNEENPIALIWFKENLLVSGNHYIFLIQWTEADSKPTITPLNDPVGGQTYGKFSQVKFQFIHSLEEIGDDMIIATSEKSGTLILLDMKKNLALPVCVDESNCTESTVITVSNDGKPRRVLCTLQTSKGLFLASEGFIYQLTGKLDVYFHLELVPWMNKSNPESFQLEQGKKLFFT